MYVAWYHMLMKHYVHNIKHYFIRNGLLLNLNAMIFFIGNRQLLAEILPTTIINCNGDIIIPNTHVKNLGVYIERYMSFYINVSKLNKKIRVMLLFINRIKENFDK